MLISTTLGKTDNKGEEAIFLKNTAMPAAVYYSILF